MSDKSISILSTRPLDELLVEQATSKNITIDQITFIEIKKQVSADTLQAVEKLSKQVATVVFTSMNAVEVLIDILPDKSNIPAWKIYCMGGATFTLVKKFWPYESVIATAKNAKELAQQIIADNIKIVHFFCGNQRREELPDLLGQQHIAVQELIIYETIETPVTVDKNYDAILFFSPSAVHSFFEKNKISDATKLFAIGETTATAIKAFCNNEIVISDFPSKDQFVKKALRIMSSKF